MATIEDIILSNDQRGISALRPHVPADYARQAAQHILDHPNRAFIITGFYILSAGAVETDGPPGALAIGRALEALGYKVWYIGDRWLTPVMSKDLLGKGEYVEFPIATPEESRTFAQGLLKKHNPSIVISIERCGASQDGLYRNMRGRDITQYTARVDYLLPDTVPTVGIGDGGNEIGMGVLLEQVKQVPSLVKDPAATKVQKLMLASVSNWGGYGLAAALSVLKRKDLLITPQDEEAMVKRIVELGAVDGIRGTHEMAVDNFPLTESARVLNELHALLRASGVR
ncbi:MAG: DUF4392 domain-containing protein [Chloroflexi bacterium]|nr:DUF4392 domain-containing protein [Chloroflexota bacterium]